MARIAVKHSIPSAAETDRIGSLLRAMNGAAEVLFMADEENFENSLREATALMGNCVNVDRIYIWQNIVKDGCVHYVQQFEWLKNPVQESKTVLSKEGFSYNETLPEWEQKFLQKECINGPLSSLSPTEQARLGPYGIKSILVTPVYFQTRFWGFVSFDDCRNERFFTAEEINILRSGNLLLASAFKRHETLARMREGDEHAKLMLDATPLCCSLWNKDLNIIDCNAEVVGLYGLKDKREYVDNFFELSPKYQPDGSPSKETALERLAVAFREGRSVYEWMHQMPDGTPIPAEVTLVRVRRGDEYIVAGYTRDLREHKKMMSAIGYKDILLHTVNEAATILLRSEINEFEDNLLRCMGMMADAVHADRVYIWKNYEKDDRLYCSQIYEWSGGAEPQQGGDYTADIPYAEFPEWEQKLSRGQCINGPARSLTAVERAHLAPQGVLSILAVPVFLRERFWGFVGFDDCLRERVFSEEEESILRSASLLIANALLRNEMTHDIQAAVEQAQAANKAKSSFLARISHEIRTPMNVITGMTELVLREDIPAPIRENILNIKHAGSNMLSLISDILDFSKIEAGNLEIVAAEYTLTSLINDVLNIIRMRASEKPLLFTVNIDCDIPNRLIGDETRIRQILLNVLDNAVKYTAEGFVSLTVTGRIQEDENTVVLTAEVSDSGIGIKKENMEKLFDDFARFEGGRHKGVQGAGLGLPITKSLCRAMGGHISVRSEYGAGSTFTITVPQKIKSRDEKFAKAVNPEAKPVLLYETRRVCADSIARSLNKLGVACALVKSRNKLYEELKRRPYAFVFASSPLSEIAAQAIEELKLDTALVCLTELGDAPAAHNARTISLPAHSASIANILNDIEDNLFHNDNGSGKTRFIAPSAKILLVDDLNTNLKVAKGLMSPYQMQIDVCESGEEAIACVLKTRYDIIFMDHMMPEMDGIEATRRIRSLKGGGDYCQTVPIIALTANAVSGVKEMFLQNGMNDFLAKPVDVAKLHGLLEKWIPKGKKEKSKETKARQIPAAASPAQIQIEGLDIRAGTAMTGGTADGYLKTLSSFHADGSNKIKKIRDSVRKKDLRSYEIHAHALKGAAAGIGAKSLSELFRALEAAAARSDTAFIHDNTERCLGELETLLKNINDAVLKSRSNAAANSAPKFLRRELSKLKKALDDRDFGEIDDIVNILETVRWSPAAKDIFTKLSDKILLIDYTGAAPLVDRLLEFY